MICHFTKLFKLVKLTISNATLSIFPSNAGFVITSNLDNVLLNFHIVVTTPYSPYLSLTVSSILSKHCTVEIFINVAYSNLFKTSARCFSLSAPSKFGTRQAILYKSDFETTLGSSIFICSIGSTKVVSIFHPNPDMIEFLSAAAKIL